jgi:hypothetical protein
MRTLLMPLIWAWLVRGHIKVSTKDKATEKEDKN